jgi:hypothetical protein
LWFGVTNMWKYGNSAVKCTLVWSYLAVSGDGRTGRGDSEEERYMGGSHLGEFLSIFYVARCALTVVCSRIQPPPTRIRL